MTNTMEKEPTIILSQTGNNNHLFKNVIQKETSSLNLVLKHKIHKKVSDKLIRYLQYQYCLIQNMIFKQFRMLLGKSSTFNTLRYQFRSHKLSYGQGGYCQLDLTKQNYRIQFETVWEDHCIVEVHGDASSELLVQEIGSKAILSDAPLKQKINSEVNIKFKIPQDYTFYGKVNGSIVHLKNNVSNKLRSNQTSIQFLGKNRLFQWGTFQTPSINILNKEGAIDMKNMTFEKGNFSCNSFSSSKISFSQQFVLQASHLVNIRSVVAFGNALSKIAAKYVEIESISGAFEIQAQKVRIQRMWASPGGIKIKTKKVEKLGIETGTGYIQSQQPVNQNAINLGRMQKSKITKISDHKISID